MVCFVCTVCVCAWLVNISFLAKEQISMAVESVHSSAVVVFQASFSSPGSASCVCLTAVLFFSSTGGFRLAVQRRCVNKTQSSSCTFSSSLHAAACK